MASFLRGGAEPGTNAHNVRGQVTPNDPRVERKEVQVNSRNYSCLFAKPESTPKGHIFLVHGFPDMSFGWRYQIPFFQPLVYEVLAPNMLGYGDTTTLAADDPAWSHKAMSDDIAALCTAVWSPETSIVLGGHDWGGALVWRVAPWHPQLLLGVFSSEEDIRRLLLAIFGARTTDTREPAFKADKGYHFDRLPRLVGKSPLMSNDELEEYVRVYSQEGSGVVGPLRCYRTRKQTFEEEKPLADKEVKVDAPCLFVQASRDMALPPAVAQGMGDNFTDLTSKTVKASHWALWEALEKVNSTVRDWLAEKFQGVARGSTL
ncbi:hypothetical protein ACHAQA_006681 [Verticillium albo-atrum]